MHKTITSNSKIQLYIKPDCSKSKKAIAYAKSIAKQVNAIDINRTKGTGTIWRSILTKLNKNPEDLLMNNPRLVRSPIAVRGNKAILLDNPTDNYKI